MSLIAASLLMLAAETGQRTFDYWMVDDGRDIDRESIVFIEKSALVQRPDGWINFSFHEVRNGSRIKTFKSRVLGTWVNCKTREYINDYRMEYGRDGALLQQGKLDEQRRIPAPGSSEAQVLAFACGDTRGATQLAKGTNVIAYADTLYAQGHPQVAKPPTTPAAPSAPASAPAEASGRQNDYWMVYDSADSGYEDFGFVNRSSIEREADGRTFFNYISVPFGSLQKKMDAKRADFAARANCQTREFVNELVQFSGGSEKDSGIYVLEEPPVVPARGSPAEKLVNFVCGNTAGATQLQGVDPVVLAEDIYLSAHEATAKAPAPRATPTPARPAETAPGLGKANWKIISDDEDRMIIYAPATIRRGQDSGKAWFTTIYSKPQTIAAKSGTVVDQRLVVANCTRNTTAEQQIATYGADGRALFAIVNKELAYARTADGSMGRIKADILCGRPVELPGLPSYNLDVAGMRKVYQGLREMSDEMSEIINAP